MSLPARAPSRLPGEALLDAIHDRLTGNVFRLDASTVVPVVDSFPKGFEADEWNFIEIADYEISEAETAGHYDCLVAIGAYSSYEGYLEVSRELDRMHALLSYTLDLSAHSFTDVSLGGDQSNARVSKLDVEEKILVRRGVYRRRWKIADDRF